jgi:hypothetical protein
MASHWTHAGPVGIPAGGSRPSGGRGRRALGASLRERLGWIWYPLWLAAAVGITRVVVDLVTRGQPTLNFGGP